MVKLKELPGLDVIGRLKGVIDFYYWKGLPCARRWPRSPGRNRAPAVQAQWSMFTYISKVWNYPSDTIRQSYEETASSTNMTARDIFVKNFLADALIKIED